LSSGGFRIVSDTLVLYVSSSAVEKLPREIYGWGGALLVVSINVFCFIYTFITSAKGVGIVTTCVCVCLWAGLLQTWCYGWAYQSEVSIYFQWWSGPGYWSRSLFHFPHHCTIHLLIHILKWHLGNLLAFLVQSAAAFYELGEMTDADKGMNSLHFGTPGSGTTSATFVQPTLTVELSRNIIFCAD